MLDKYTNAVADRLSNIIAAVGARRADFERQRSTDRYAQNYLGTALKHPEGHTTPLRKSAERAQQEYASVRAEWAKKGPEALALFASLMVARERRDETKAVWARHDAAEQERSATKYHPEVRRLFGQLFDHGITPAMVEQLWPETIGMIADVILWQAFDPSGADSASPLPSLFEFYAERTMVMPEGAGDPGRSVPGIAPAQVRYSDPSHYRFDDVAAGLGPGLSSAAIVEDARDVEPADEAPDASAIDVPAEPVDDEPGAHVPPADAGEPPKAEMPTLNAETATAWAQRMLATDPHVRIYWPRNYPVGDFDQERLAKALGEEAAAGKAWSGALEFLTATKAGEAETFIADRYQESVRWRAQDLIARKPEVMERARTAGLWGSGTGSGPS